MIDNNFIQSSTIGAVSTNYHINTQKKVECDCGRFLFATEGNKIEIKCRRCRKKKIIIYDEKEKEFKVIE